MSRGARAAFWRSKPMSELSREEWDSLCSGCGRCCVIKYEDPDTLEVNYTKWACRYLDLKSCRCTCFRSRKQRMPECLDLYQCAATVMEWLPSSCSYRLLAEGHDLPSWHPLVTGDSGSTCKAGMSVRGHVVREPVTADFETRPLGGTLMMNKSTKKPSEPRAGVPSGLPTLLFDNPKLGKTLGEAHRQALHNLVDINTVAAPPETYNKTGFLPAQASMIRAGGDYQTPWTRDASINSWNAASLLIPEIARNTLWAVCERLPNGRMIVNRDNQWWDKVIWITAAWNHYAVTGDAAFLKAAYATGQETLRDLRSQRWDREFGLFKGPAMMQDGIAGYPEPPFQAGNGSDFVLDHPASHSLMVLSTNCLYYSGFRSLAAMAGALGKAPSACAAWLRQAGALKDAINRHLWMPERKTYAYFVHGEGDLRGARAGYQEALGLSLCILLEVANPERRANVMAQIRVTARGIPLVDPEFSRNSADKIGRHSRILWPMAQGYWAHAAARQGDLNRFQSEMESLARLAQKSDWNFMEIYNPVTGLPDGGWQAGKHWDSCKHQTWSATAYLRMVYSGLFGMTFAPGGVAFAPSLPKGWGAVGLVDLTYRDAVLEVRLSGAGNRVTACRLDGKPVAKAFVPARLKGLHRLELVLGPGRKT